MDVLGVLVVWGVLGLSATGVDTKEAAEVKKEVEKIFQTVDQLLTGKSTDLRRDSRTPTTQSSVRRQEHNRVPDKEVSTVLPSLLHPLSRSFASTMTPFPVGIVVSDHLYPLVVGRNPETGKPFVVNLEKQHAMIVASGSAGRGYRMLIPFPMMLGTPKYGGVEEGGPPLIPAPDYSNPLGKSPDYITPHPLDIPEGKSRPILKEPINYYPSGRYNKYAQNYHYRPHNEVPYFEQPRYNKYLMKPPKKYIIATNPNIQGKGKPYLSSSNGSPINSRPLAPQRPAYLTNPEKSLSYYVEGPNYNPHLPPEKSLSYYAEGPNPNPHLHPEKSLSHYTEGLNSNPHLNPEKSLSHYSEGPNQNLHSPTGPKTHVPIAYRHNANPYSVNGAKYRSYMPGSPPPPSRNSHYRNYYNEHPVLSSALSSPRYPPVYGGGPQDFKPSPYIGEIDAYGRDAGDKDVEDSTTLQPQSELFESYDDRGEDTSSDKDFDDPGSDSPEGRQTSSGGVQHVTYHADDYLGKIYEEMYYRLPSTERIDTNQEPAPQVFPPQDYEAEGATEAAEQVRPPHTEAADRRSDQDNAGKLSLQTETKGTPSQSATKR